MQDATLAGNHTRRHRELALEYPLTPDLRGGSMSIVGFCRRPVLMTVVLAGLATGRPSVALAAPDACALLTAAELSAAVGQPLGPPAPSGLGDGGGQCMYGYVNQIGSQIGIELWQLPSAAEAQKKFSSELNDSKDAIGSQKPIAESGVGEGAFSKLGGLLSMKATEWMAVRGSRVVHIAIVAASVPTHDRLRALMLTALAR
jgi:hypothetical protein